MLKMAFANKQTCIDRQTISIFLLRSSNVCHPQRKSCNTHVISCTLCRCHWTQFHIQFLIHACIDRQTISIFLLHSSNVCHPQRKSCHAHVISCTLCRCHWTQFRIQFLIHGTILQDARIVRQGKRMKLFAELMKRARSALRTR